MRALRLAARQLRRHPFVSLIAMAVIAIGIGATTAVFSIVNGVLLAPLPFPEPERVVHLGGKMMRDSSETDWPLSPLDLEAERELDDVFAAVAVVSNLRSFNLTAAGEIEHVDGEMVSADLFAAYGLRPSIGRAFTDEETRAPGAAVVIISHDLWRRRFGADPQVIGRSISLNDASYAIVGVMPPGFHGASDEAHLWLPIGLAPVVYGQAAYLEMRQFRWAQGIARLRAGVTVAAAQRRSDAHARELAERFPTDNRGLRFELTPLAEVVRGGLRGPLLALMAASGLVLLIACTNVANLLLGRAAARSRELALRRALGAGTVRLLGQLTAEGLVLSGAGAVAGVVLAVWLVGALLRFGSLDVATFQHVGVDLRVLLFAVLVALLATLAFGLLPALLASRGAPGDVLHDAGRAATGGVGRGRLESGLIAAEVALAVVVLAAAALTTRGFRQFMQRDLGYRPEGVLTLRMDFTAPRFASNDAYRLVLDDLRQRVRGLPGVSAAALEGPGYPTFGPYLISLQPADRPADPGQSPQARRHNVSPDYFATLGIPIRGGRGIGPEDQPGGAPVVVVSEALARRLWPGQDPIGRRLVPNGNAALTLTIVGVVGDVRHSGPDLEADPFGDAYFAAAQFPPRNPALATLLVRGDGPVARLIGPVTSIIKEAAPGVAPYSVATLPEHLADKNADGRFLVFVMTGFAAVALVLAAVGIYGVVRASVTRRTREIGIRIALGAARRDVVGLMLRRALGPVTLGAAIGGVGALALGRIARSLLYGLNPRDPFTLTLVFVVLFGVALVAGWLPARRATRIDPLVAFRAE